MTTDITVEMALDQATRATDLATKLAGALEEARALLIQVLAIEPHELEPPILKEQGELAQARKMDRKLLEEKYVLARMATRLSMRKVHELEGEVERLNYRQQRREG